MKRPAFHLKNKNLIRFFERALFFLIILCLETLLLSVFIDFQFTNIQGLFIKTEVHFMLLLFVVIFFILSLHKFKKIKKLEKLDYTRFISLLFLHLAAVFFFYRLNVFIIKYLEIVNQHTLLYSVLWYVNAISIPLILLFAFFEYDFVKKFTKTFENQLWLSLVLAFISFWILENSIKLWVFFSKITSKAVYFLLSIFFNGANYTIGANNIPVVGIPAVAAKIYAPCSGVEGMVMFLILFTLLVLVDYKKFNMKKVFILYPIGVVGAFVVNILRTFLIFVVGHFTSQEFAVGAFHSNAGWILFTIYFLAFVYFAYPWTKKKH